MAFTKTPGIDTEQTKKLPFIQQWETRTPDNLKDTDSVNIVWDTVQDPNGSYIAAIKREGVTTYLVDLPPASEIYGMYYWESPNSTTNHRLILIGAFGAMVFDLNTATRVGWDNSYAFEDAVIGFTEFQFDDGLIGVYVTDGIRMYECGPTATLIQITDPDFPSPHLPYPVYLDGYLFIGTANGDIYNSGLNDPFSWSTANLISVDAYPDRLRAIARHGSYIVAFGGSSIQFFYDAANSTGTPLAVYSASTPQIGFLGGLIAWGESLLFLGLNRNGTANVYRLEGFKVVPVGAAVLARRLVQYNESTVHRRKGHILAINGHNLYTWGEYVSLAPPVGYTEKMYAVDLENGLWTRLTYQGSDVFRIRTSAVCRNFNRSWTMLTFYTDSTLSQFSATAYQDKDVNFTTSFQTKNEDFGTRRLKFGARLLVNSDQTPSTSLCSVSWSDDDYQTFSTPRTVDLSNAFPHLSALGSFRRRAHKVTYTDNFPMRWTDMELDYNQGQA